MVPLLAPGEDWTQDGLTLYQAEDERTYRHRACPDPLGLHEDGVIWGDDVGNMTCGNCGLFSRAPGADADGVVPAA